MNSDLANLLIFAAVLAWPVERWLAERRRRKFSYHRLMIARAVTQMERLMGEGKIRMGEACHDQVHGIMQKAQYCERFPVRVLPGKLSREDLLFRERLINELSRGTPAAEPIRQFADHFMGAFQADRPIASRYFTWMTLIQWLVHQVLPPAVPTRRSPRNLDCRATVRAELLVRSTHVPELSEHGCPV